MADARGSQAHAGGPAVAAKRPHLAIDGGTPVRRALLPYGHQQISEEEIAEVARVLRGDWITQGPVVGRFERLMAELTGRRHAVAFSSGTAALHACAWAAGLGAGSEAVAPTLSFVASANAAAFMGARPALADVDPRTLNLTAAEAERRLTPRTRAIIAVDFAGLPCEAESLRDLARRRGLILIQDSCHALGAQAAGRPAGSLADFAAFSFHPVKALTTGEGGMAVTDDSEAARRLRRFASHGLERDADRMERRDGPWSYEMQDLGYNFRITDFQCALGIAQAERLPSFIARRQEIARRYDEALASEEGIRRAQPPPAAGTGHAYHLYLVRLDLRRLKVDRRRVFEALRAENIGVQVHYLPIHLQAYYRRAYGYREGDFPEAEKYYAECLSLPVFPAMTDADADDVIEAVRRVLAAYRS